MKFKRLGGQKITARLHFPSIHRGGKEKRSVFKIEKNIGERDRRDGEQGRAGRKRKRGRIHYVFLRHPS